MQIRIIRKLLFLLFTFLCVCEANSQGVLFSEYRVILNENAVTSMYITNPTKETFTYTISFLDKRMDENGKVTDVPNDEVPDFSIKKYLRVFPRSVVLEPGKSQEVQIQLKTPPSLPDGEYRSFINFAPREPNHQIETEDEEGVKMSIQFNVASAIPIIYRKNATVDDVVIDDVTLAPLNDSTSVLDMTLKRKGTRSVYGKIFVAGISDGKETLVFTPKGSNVIYPEIPSLRVSIPLKINNLDRDENRKIKLKISYIDSEKQRVKNPVLFASKEVEFNVP